MNVGRAGGEGIRNLSEREIMRRHETDGASFDQSFHDSFSSNRAIMRVGAVEDFVEEKQKRNIAFCQVHGLTNALNLCIEARCSRLERIVNSNRRANRQRA